MSERILKALMQLFAIIAKDDEVSVNSRTVVRIFLRQQVSLDQVDIYLDLFDSHVAEHNKLSKSGRKRKRTSVNSVKVLLICTQINSELAQKQKLVVLLRLLEFIHSGEEVSEQELEFVHTVAITFNINELEYNELHEFVKASGTTRLNSKNLLIVSSEKPSNDGVRYINSDSIIGHIKVLQIESTGMYIMRYFGGNELFLNGQLIEPSQVYFLTIGSSIRSSKVNPIYYSDITGKFFSGSDRVDVSYQVRDLEFKFNNNKQGLYRLNLHEKSGNLIGIMGASGAGKSTLLSLMNGTTTPTSGEILINGLNIHTQKEELEGIIGHISQDDLLIEDLTVFQNLYYNAKLCFDGHSEKDIVKRVIDVLKSIGLYEIKDLKVGSPLNKKISGGQRKRLNIALELIREPVVLFVDEPTSGLSSRDSENIMDLLNELAQKGKLIFVVIHQPSSDIFKMFDNLLILDTGGFPIYYGNPIDAVIYFKKAVQHVGLNESECKTCGNVNPEQIFNIIETKVVDEYGQMTVNRKITPKQWNKVYKDLIQEGLIKKSFEEPPKTKPVGSYKVPRLISQLKVFTIRDTLAKIANTQYMLINFLEAPILGFILAYLVKFFSTELGAGNEYLFRFNENIPAFLFMSVVVALFMGMTVSAEEIISDQKILKREKFLNLSKLSYLNSKVLILFTISAIQTLTFVLVGNTILEIQGMYLPYWLVLFSTSCFANILGLNISATFNSVKTIYIFIPILLIPQLLLSGVIVKFDKLNPSLSSQTNVPWTGEMMTSRWAFEALATYQFINNEYDSQFYDFEQLSSVAGFKKNFWYKELETKCNLLKKQLKTNKKESDFNQTFDLIINELKKEDQSEYHDLNTPTKIFEYTASTLTIPQIESIKNHLSIVKHFYLELDNENRNIKNSLIYSYQSDSSTNAEFLESMYRNSNESLDDLLKNKTEVNKILEHNGEFIQKADPVYKHGQGLRAHFFAPTKELFGKRLSTFTVNTLVIWFMTFALFIILYFDGFAKLLDLFSLLFERFIPKEHF